jgi:two-component system, cell cycle response regulator CpdR
VARILIAEDEDAIRNLIARALRQDGHDVITAIDGAQALDVLAREKGAFELLLTDIRMPVMMASRWRTRPHAAILLSPSC